jgi:glycosyltransferase involved in cell wall biosynthesis
MSKASVGPPHLVFVVTEDWYFVSHRLHTAIAAAESGYNVSVICRAGPALDQIEAAGIAHIPFDMQRRSLNPFVLLIEIFGLFMLFRRLKPDILHLVALRPVLVGGIAARVLGIKGVVAAIAGMGFLFTDATRHPWIGRIVGRVIAVALSGRRVIVQNRDDWMKMAGFGLREEDLCLVPGAGVDTNYFIPKAQRSPGKRKTVTLPARLLTDKGVREFVEAAKRLGKIDARFVLVGAVDLGNPSAINPADIAQWQEDDIIEYWGHREDMRAVFHASDVVVLPSYREGMPKVLLEAMACGLPCVTTDVTGCRDTVVHGVTGLIVPARDPNALSNAIAQLLKDAVLCQDMGRAGRDHVVKKFSSAIVNKIILQIYRDARGPIKYSSHYRK